MRGRASGGKAVTGAAEEQIDGEAASKEIRE